jgi:hypothetical protein
VWRALVLVSCRETGGLLKIDHAKDNVRTTLDLDYTKKTGNASVVVTKDSVYFIGQPPAPFRDVILLGKKQREECRSADE